MSREFMMGTSIQSQDQLDRMQEAGVEWLRTGVPFPFEGKLGKVSERFRSFREKAQDWHRRGFRLLAITPCPRDFMDAGGVGVPGGPLFMDAYEEGCRFMAQELGEVAPIWQIANELNLVVFRMPLTVEEAIEFARRGAKGLRKGNPSAKLGLNMAGFWESGAEIYQALYSDPELVLDYAGIDLYYGSFEPGGPESFRADLNKLTDLTGKPVVVAEWGYGSMGETMNEAEQAENRRMIEHGRWQDWFDYPHQIRKWGFSWKERTPETQAEYVEQTYALFMDMPNVIGTFWCCWSDAEWCLYCGYSDCTWNGWGLVDVHNHPKPAYYALQKAAQAFKSLNV